MMGFNHSRSILKDAGKIVADHRSNLQEEGVSNRNSPAKLFFTAVAALLGVKILRRNAEHVVTLNANTMKRRLPRRRGFVFRGMGLRLSGFVCHG
jgi:hypothetical protein